MKTIEERNVHATKTQILESTERPVRISGTVWLTGSLVALLPIVLLLNPRFFLGGDYRFILWMVGYIGEYVRHHLCWPNTLNGKYFTGLMQLQFYGFNFFPVIGTLSALTGATLALRLTIAGLFLGQFWTVFKTFLSLRRDKTLAFGIATLVSWNIYPLTNLYNRGAIAEFSACALLTCSFCYLLKLILLSRKQQSIADHLLVGLCFTAAAVAHPITFQYGTLFFACMLLPLLPLLNLKNVLRWAAPNAVMTLAVLVPWVYLVLDVFKVPDSAFGHPSILANDVDSIWCRFAPLPFDPRAVSGGTPYLDTQLSVPLVIVALAMLACCVASRSFNWQRSKVPITAAVVAAVLFAMTVSVSVTPNLANCFGHVFDHLQFGFRLITYSNLALIALIASLGRVLPFPDTGFKAARNYVAIACLGIAFIGLGMKLMHASAVATDEPPDQSSIVAHHNGLLDLDPTATPYRDYICTTSFSPSTNLDTSSLDVAWTTMPVGSGRQFGWSQPLELRLRKQTLVVTDVIPFPWNHLRLDYQDVPPQSVLLRDRPGNMTALCMIVPAGQHLLQYAFKPDSVWSALTVLSRLVSSLWLLTAFIFTVRERMNKTP